MTTKRLKAGNYLKGPEPFGCFNSGFAPVLYHVPIKERGRSWIVCRDIMLDNARLANVNHKNDHKRKIRFPGRAAQWDAWLFKGRKAAQAKFDEMCKASIDSNRQDRERAIELKKKAQRPDADGIAAILELGDMGVL